MHLSGKVPGRIAGALRGDPEDPAGLLRGQGYRCLRSLGRCMPAARTVLDAVEIGLFARAVAAAALARGAARLRQHVPPPPSCSCSPASLPTGRRLATAWAWPSVPAWWPRASASVAPAPDGPCGLAAEGPEILDADDVGAGDLRGRHGRSRRSQPGDAGACADHRLPGPARPAALPRGARISVLDVGYGEGRPAAPDRALGASPRTAGAALRHRPQPAKRWWLPVPARRPRCRSSTAPATCSTMTARPIIS